MNFTGLGTPMSSNGVQSAQTTAGVESAGLWSVISVETTGCGYLSDRRPKILFERHIFSRLTNGQFDADDPDVSAPTPGGYGPGGANQYLRLQAAINLDEDAALQSASWGLGQIMGENFAAAGFSNPTDMINAFVASEDAQLLGMATFIANSGMTESLSNGDWASFARLYNGPNFAANNYDGLLAHFFGIYSTGATPDLLVRAVQIYLTYKGYSPGVIDGVVGKNTVTAAKAFQTSAGVSVTGVIDGALLQLLEA